MRPAILCSHVLDLWALPFGVAAAIYCTTVWDADGHRHTCSELRLHSDDDHFCRCGRNPVKDARRYIQVAMEKAAGKEADGGAVQG